MSYESWKQLEKLQGVLNINYISNRRWRRL